METKNIYHTANFCVTNMRMRTVCHVRVRRNRVAALAGGCLDVCRDHGTR